MSSFRRPSNSNIGDSVVYGGADLHVITDLLNGVIIGIPPVKLKSENLVSVWDGILRFADVADNTRFVTIKSSNGIAASRTLTIPNLAANDTIQVLNLTQTPINKTINLSNNTVTDTSAVSGEIVVHNGTKFVRLPIGTNVQFLRGDGVWATAPGQGGGEANTASNVGTVGTGIFKQKASLDLEFYKINPASNKLTIALNGTDRVDLDVAESNLTLGNLGGTLGVSKGGTGATTLTGLLIGNGTSAFTTVTAPAGTVVGTSDTQTLTNKTVNATNNTITDSSTAAGDILKSNGTKFLRLARGTAGQVLKVNAGGTDIEWGTDATGGGGSGNTSTLFKNTTAVAATNTSAETNILNHSITGGTIGINGILHIVIAGYYKNDSGSDDQFDLRLKLGGTILWQDSSGTMTDATDQHPFYLELWIKNMNSASVQRVTGMVSHGNAALADVGFSDLSQDDIRGNGPINASGAINTGSTQSVVVSIDHADADTNISFNADVVFLELVAS